MRIAFHKPILPHERACTGEGTLLRERRTGNEVAHQVVAEPEFFSDVFCATEWRFTPAGLLAGPISTQPPFSLPSAHFRRRLHAPETFRRRNLRRLRKITFIECLHSCNCAARNRRVAPLPSSK